MRLLILSKDKNLYTTRRFLDASKNLSVDLNYINPLDIAIYLNNKPDLQLFIKEKPLFLPDGIINRFGIRGFPFGFVFGHYCKTNSIPVINPFDSIIYGKNKIIALNIARELQIEIPPTYFPSYASNLSEEISQKIPPPYIIKVQSGTQGIGVMLARDMATLQAISDYLWDKNDIFIVQHYYDNTEKDLDIRLLFFDNIFLGGFSKVSDNHEFRSNFHRGGKIKKFSPSEDLIKKSQALLKKTGLRFAGIDFIIRKNQIPLFLEINESPGFEAFEQVHGKIVAEIVLEILLSSLK